jgi:hypothetical protein
MRLHWPKKGNAKLIMLHVLAAIATLNPGLRWYSRMDRIEQQEPACQRTPDRLAQLIPKDEDLPCTPEFQEPLDTLPWRVLNVADEGEADLIVMGVNRGASFGFLHTCPGHSHTKSFGTRGVRC